MTTVGWNSETETKLNITRSLDSGLNGFHFGPTMRMDFKEGRFVPSLAFGVFYQFMESAYPFGSTKQEYKDLVKDGKKSETDMTDPDADKFSNIFNMYWNLGAGVNFCNHFSASVSYETCLSNQSYLTSLSIGDMTEEYDLRDSFLKISFGYTF